MDNWTFDLETIICSMIKTKTYETLVAKYPNISYTTEESTIKDTKFPNVYIHLTTITEIGNDLENETINAVSATVQVDVTANTKKSDAKNVIYEVMEILKQSRFDINFLPIFTKDNDVHRAIMTASRTIGNSDIL